MKKKFASIVILLFIILQVVGIYFQDEIKNFINKYATVESYALSDIPEYNNEPYVVINNNEPEFSDEDKTTKSFEKYDNLDYLGRATKAFANISTDLMPTEKRGNIGMVKPSGWHTVKYDIVDGKYLYNRCHLIGYQLTGENANENNLITCTRNTNTSTMLDMENKVTEYIKKTNNHVLYRVRAIYDGDNLLASGIQMEALSIEDNGKGIKFNIYIYNVQPGIKIDYKTGDSELEG
jgi:DNA-entry nuclease